MPNAQQHLEIKSLTKGLNTYDPATAVPAGFYVDAQNMVLTNKTPKTVGGLTKLTTTAAPNNEVVVWFEPYTPTGDDDTHLLVATDAGTLYKYSPSTDTWDTLLLGLSTTQLVWTHVPFRGQLFFSNGSDPIFKYDGTNVLPLGGNLVADMEEDENWAGGTVSSTSTSLRREGLRARIVAAGSSAVLTYASAADFETALNGGNDFGAADRFKIDIFKADAAPNGTALIVFTTSVGNFASYSTTISTNGWSTLNIARSAFTVTGVMDWSSVTTFTISVTAGDSYTFDNAYFQYAESPPVGGLIELYNQQLVVSGIASDLVSIQYSDPGTPDEFPASNIARFSGGRHALEKTDQITALRAYFDELIVGKVNSAWTFSGTGDNVSISALPLTIGVDGHRGIVETPWSLHFLFENNIFGARLTSRGLVSTNISSLLQDIDGTELDKIVAIRHDRSHLIRWSMRTTNADGQNDLGLLYDYQLDAWCSRFTPAISYYTRGIVDGNREVLCAQYDGHIRRCDVGNDFDGEAIESYVTLPYMQTESQDKLGNVTRWLDFTMYVRGDATVNVDARFADEPHEFDDAEFTTFGTIAATPDGDKGFGFFGRTARWIQLRLRATSGSFEVLMPMIIGYADTARSR